MPGTPLTITAPCSACKRDVRFGEATCGSCGAKVSREVKDALARRLEAADPAYRGLANQVWGASTTLLYVGIAQLVMLAFQYWFAHDRGFTPDRDSSHVDVVASVAVAGVMIGCWVVARWAPITALVAGLIAFVAAQAIIITIGGVILLSAWLMLAKALIVAFLLRGIVSAVRVRRLRARLAAVPPAPLPQARLRS